MNDNIKPWNGDKGAHVNSVHSKVYSCVYHRKGLTLTAVIVAPNLVKAKLMADAEFQSMGYSVTVQFGDLCEISTSLDYVHILGSVGL